AGAVRAEQRENLAAANLQVDVLERLKPGGVDLVQMDDGDRGGHCTSFVIPGLEPTTRAQRRGPVDTHRLPPPRSQIWQCRLECRVEMQTWQFRCRLRAAAARRNDRGLNPRPRRLGLFLEALDLRALGHGQADVVEAFEQAVLAMLIDLELDHAAVRAAD